MPWHVTAAARRRRPGVVVHRDALMWRDRTRQLGIPVTSPARTLLDVASLMTERALIRAVNDLLLQGFSTHRT